MVRLVFTMLKKANARNRSTGTMLGIPVDALFTAVNIAYLVSLGLTLLLGIVLWRVSTLSQADKDAQLERYKSRAAVEIAAANATAATARKEAAEASARAEEKVAAANERAASADGQVAAANERTAVLEAATTKAKLDLARLTTPRTVTPEQIERLRELLKDAPRGALILDTGIANRESQVFVGSLLNAFQTLGYFVKVRPSSHKPVVEYDIPGVAFEVHDRQKAPLFALSLMRALREIGFTTGMRAVSQRPPGEVWVMVGPRF